MLSSLWGWFAMPLMKLLLATAIIIKAAYQLPPITLSPSKGEGIKKTNPLMPRKKF
jgi:hypothetical protein